MVVQAPPSPPTWPEHRADENVAEEYGVGGIYMDEEYGGMDMEEYAMPPEHELHELEASYAPNSRANPIHGKRRPESSP